MSDNSIHIISFNIPYPPNYGGVIDVFYKIKALHSAGIKIHLHCFEYGREIPEQLNSLCEHIYYYKRNTSILSALSCTPYIVKSRKSEALIQNLLKNDYPILFEGLHTCYYIKDERLADRLKIYRESNIEHLYYYNLFKSEKNLFKRLYFLSAAFKLRIYQRMLKYADLMLVVSESDTSYLMNKFPINEVIYLPSFHSNDIVSAQSGLGKYVLYHGNLSVAENDQAASYLINKVFKDIEIPFLIAGLNPSERLKSLVAKHKNITLIANPDEDAMEKLLAEAQINILITFQATGLKLKLLNTLYSGRYCVVNSKMLAGTALDSLCHIADTPESLKEKLNLLFNKEFDASEIEKRKIVLSKNYSNTTNLQKLVGFLTR